MRTIGRLLSDKARRIGTTWLRWGDRTWSYEDAHRLTNRYARGLARLGVAKGTHVAVMLPNCVEYFGVVWGLGKLGAVAVPLNTAAKGELLKYFIDQSTSEWVVVADEWEDRVAEILPTLPHVKGCLRLARAPLRGSPLAGSGANLRPESARGRDGRRPRPRSGHHRDPHLIMYTSGTTGPSKGVHLPHSQGHAVGRLLARIRISQRRCNLCLSTAIPRQRLQNTPAIQRFGRTPRWRFPSVSPVSQFWNDIGERRNSIQCAGRHDQHVTQAVSVIAG